MPLLISPFRKVHVIETLQPYGRRRGERVLLRVPVEVRGTAQDGSVLEESAHTGVVGPLEQWSGPRAHYKWELKLCSQTGFLSRQRDFESCGSGNNRPTACGKSGSNHSCPWMTSGVCAFPRSRINLFSASAPQAPSSAMICPRFVL